MSEELGNMAWGPRGPVFLGEELMHTRDYSDETARVIDREVSRILAGQSNRAREVLEQHRTALDAVAEALAAHESLEGAEVAAVVQEAEHPGDAEHPGKPGPPDPDTLARPATGFSH